MVQLKYVVAPVALLSGVFAEVHTVTVGPGDTFSPDSLTAAQGDFVEFHFNGRHSVAQGAFNEPCASTGSDDIFSGVMSSGVFTVKVNTTDPIFYYCSYSNHCQGGMVGVINQGSDTLASYKSASSSTSKSSPPSNVQGGYVGTADLTSGSDSSSSSSASSSTSAADSSASSAAASSSVAGSSAAAASSGATTATSGSSSKTASASGNSASATHTNAASSVQSWGMAGLVGVIAAIAA